jgi:ribosomal protein L22
MELSESTWDNAGHQTHPTRRRCGFGELLRGNNPRCLYSSRPDSSREQVLISPGRITFLILTPSSARSLRRPQPSLSDFYESFSKLCLCHVRTYHATPIRNALSNITTKSPIKEVKAEMGKSTTPEQRREAAAKRAREKLKADEQKATANSQKLGSLADNSLFVEDEPEDLPQTSRSTPDSDPFADRNLSNMSVTLNPRPGARAHWLRKMVIRDIRHRGRMTKKVHIARTERSHLSRSHFFKTSMKKLAPLARQIAGKSIDEAILQMRFSVKKAARDVREHLITARNEAIVARGMGLGLVAASSSDSSLEDPQSQPQPQPTSSAASEDPSYTPALPTQNPTKSLKDKSTRNPTDIYIAEAWTNRGPYGQEPDYRAKGRTNLMRPPYTGISVLLKEEKTRTREQQEKEAKAIRKRMGKNMWTQLPDRPVVRQSQQVLW